MKDKKKAYLYRRFSKRIQAKGDSLRRQSKYADEWCSKHNAELMCVHTDDGISGYSGKHASVGALSIVLRDIEDGKIEKGSYLLVENLDRLGRDEISTAHERFTSILRNGINIVTLMDGKIFTPDSVNNLADIMWALMYMARANEESLTKSKRSKSIWNKKHEQILNGEKPKIKCPTWIFYNKETDEYEANEKIEVIRKLFKLYLSGMSMAAVAKELNAENIPSLNSKKQWTQSTVSWVLKSKNTYGVLERQEGDYDDFFPAAITKHDFFLVQAEIKRKEKKTGLSRRSESRNLLTGIATCGCCGSPMNMQGKDRQLKGGGVADYRYLVCSSSRYKNLDERCPLKGIRYKYVEVIVSVLLSAMESLPKSKESADARGILKGKIDSLSKEIDNKKQQIENLLNILQDIKESESLSHRLSKLEYEKEILIDEKNDVEINLSELNVSEDSESLEHRLKDLSLKINDNKYRLELMSILNRVVEKWEFNEDGSVNVLISNHNIFINKVKGDVEISLPNKKIKIKTK